MTKRRPVLAKLSRPRLHDSVARERLFTQLDALTSSPIILVTAPPGAGKTTLVASYLDARRLGGIWFHADPGDADLSTFFYFLGVAAAAPSGRRRPATPLPILTPEYLHDLPGFARRFFRMLFQRMRKGSALVLDNFQELGESDLFHGALAQALEEVPNDIRVFLVSRHSLTDRYARLVANRQIGMLEWDDLQLTGAESGELLQTMHLNLEEGVVRNLHEQSGGWAAGLVLLAEQARRGTFSEDAVLPDSLSRVFAYFAGQLFDRMPVHERRILVQLSVLPAVTEQLAADLTGSDEAFRLLERLYLGHLFTDLRHSPEPSFTFHALFRAFLRHRAGAEMSAAERTDSAARAASLLEAMGDADAAMPLYVEAADTRAAEALILRVAGRTIGQGRWKVVTEWIRLLPPELVQKSPRLQLWLGTAHIGVDPAGARRTLADAHRVALTQDDPECAVLAAAGIVDAYFLEYAEFVPLDPWIGELDRMHAPGFRFSDLESELRARSAMLVACTYRAPGHPHVDGCALRVRELLSTGIDVNLRVSAGTHLTLYAAFTDHLDEGLRASTIVVPLLANPAVHIFRRIFGWAVQSWYSCCARNHSLGSKALEELMRIAREDEMHIAERFVCVLGYYLDMDRGDAVAGKRRIDRFEAIMDPSQPYEAASLVNMKAWHGLYTDDPVLTLRQADEAVRLFDGAGSIPHIVNAYNAYIWGRTESGDEKAARHAIEVQRELTASPNMAWGRWCSDAAEALMALRGGDEASVRGPLSRIFGKDWQPLDQYGHQLSWQRPWASTLAEAALRRGVCVENARRYIRTHDLEAPGPLIPEWPWPVRILTLGRFAIEVDGTPLAFAGRAPHRTLSLLKALIAFGAQDVKDHLLIDALWPDEDGDMARDAFRVAMHRLRKLLGHASAVVVEDGTVSLDARLCWVDAMAFEAALHAPADAAVVASLYRGDFLPADSEEPWSMGMRERLKQRFVRHAAAEGPRLEAEGRIPEAASIYARLIDVGLAHEGHYRSLMRCLGAEGRWSELIGVFEQLRRMLATKDSSVPSPECEALYRQALNAVAPF